jgi:uncharacterized protein (DUF849 family)
MAGLATVMVAPNGARRTKADHPALPVTIAEIAACARQCFAAGAGAIHAHVRDAGGVHVLDAGLYRELIGEIGRSAPGMTVQITTEAVGRYTPREQRAVVRQVMPQAVSVAPREMMADGDVAAARSFYHWAREAAIAVQHILYAPGEVARLGQWIADGTVPSGPQQVLYVLGRHRAGEESSRDELQPFLDAAGILAESPDWAVCAFGRAETECLVAAAAMGGKMRVGFENSLWNADGSLARSNAERVRRLFEALQVTPG